MTKSTKQNIFIIISYLIILSVGIYGLFDYYNNRNFAESLREKIKQEYCLDNSYVGTEYETICNYAYNPPEEETKHNFFNVFYSFIDGGKYICIADLTFIMILFINIPSLYYVCSYLKNKTILNELTRRSYKECMIDFFKKAYKPIIIYPLICITGILIGMIIANSYNTVYIDEMGLWPYYLMKNIRVFILAILINAIIPSITFVNVGLCCARKNHNLFAANILSFLFYIALDVFLELVCGNLIAEKIFHVEDAFLAFNIFKIVNNGYAGGFVRSLTVPFIVMILSFVMVLLLYKNKEKLIIDCEKNEVEEN